MAEISARLGVSAHSLYRWVKAATPDKTEKQATELLGWDNAVAESFFSSLKKGADPQALLQGTGCGISPEAFEQAAA